MKLVRSLLCGVVAGALAFSGAASAQKGINADGKVTIGIMTDLEDIWSDAAGQGSIIAMEMAVEDFGGKVLGKDIEILVGDHKIDKSRAMKVLEQWHKQNRVDAVFELSGSHIAIPVNNYAKENEISTFVSGAGSELITGRFCSPYSYHWAFNTPVMASIAGPLVKQGSDKWFVIAVSNVFGKGVYKITKDIVEESGGKMLGVALHGAKDEFFRKQVEQAIKSGANVIAVANGGEGAAKVIRQIVEYGGTQNDQQIVSFLTDITDVRTLGLYSATGLQFTQGFYWNFDAKTRQWAERFYARHGAMPTMNNASVYSSVLHYLRAVEAAGTDETVAVNDQIRRMKPQDFFVRNGYIRSDGRLVRDMYVAKVKDPLQADHAWDYLEITSVIDGVQAYGADPDPKCENKYTVAKK